MTPEAAAKYKAKLGEYLPEASVEPVFDFMTANAVQLRITRERLSKLGDYHMPHPGHPYHEISINGDLDPQYFLWVLLHEMAHLDAWLEYRTSIQPHGHEWQEHYRRLIRQHLELGAFMPEAAELIRSYIRRIPLNHATGNKIELMFRQSADDGMIPILVLNDLAAGDKFVLKNRPDMMFAALERRRTRWKCRNEKTGQLFTVSGTAEVIKI